MPVTKKAPVQNPFTVDYGFTTDWRIKIGPPGTGKTYWINNQVAKAVAAYGPEFITLLSFSRGAVAELQRRVSLPYEQITTIHAAAYRALGKPPLTETPKARDSFNAYADAQGAEWACLSPLKHGPDEDFEEPAEHKATEGPADDLFEEYNTNRARLVPEADWSEDLQAWAGLWRAWKDENELVDFPDLIDMALELTTTAPGNPICLFVDEAQDLSKHQMELIRHWGSKCLKVIIVGDPDQNLYEWAGTDPEAFWTLDVPPEHVSVLEQSYRVPKAVHGWATAWIERTPERAPVAYKPTEVLGEVGYINTGYSMPGPMIDTIEEWLGDPAFITRAAQDNVPNALPVAMVLATCSYMLVPILSELQRRGIKYFNPYRRKRGDWNMPSVASQRRLLSYLFYDLDVWPEHADPERAPSYRDVWDWAELMGAGAFRARGLKLALANVAGEDATAHDPFTPELAQEYFVDNLAAGYATGDLGPFTEYLLDSKTKPMQFALTIASERGSIELRNPPQVVVGTYYSVKGGAAQNVILLPDLSPAAQKELDTGQRAENALTRLVYVGATRAAHGLWLAARSGDFYINWPDWEG